MERSTWLLCAEEAKRSKGTKEVRHNEAFTSCHGSGQAIQSMSGTHRRPTGTFIPIPSAAEPEAQVCPSGARPAAAHGDPADVLADVLRTLIMAGIGPIDTVKSIL